MGINSVTRGTAWSIWEILSQFTGDTTLRLVARYHLMILHDYHQILHDSQTNSGSLNDHQTPEISALQGHIRYNKCKGKGVKALIPLHFEAGV